MNGLTARYPLAARRGRTSSQVWAVSGKPCRRSTSGPVPSDRQAKRIPLASTKSMATLRRLTAAMGARRGPAQVPDRVEHVDVGEHVADVLLVDAPRPSSG